MKCVVCKKELVKLTHNNGRETYVCRNPECLMYIGKVENWYSEKELKDKEKQRIEERIKHYYKQGVSQRRIGKKVGISHTAVENWLRK